MTDHRDENAPTEPLQYVAARIRDAIADDPRVHMLDVEVRVVGDKVFLHGRVPNEERRQAIGDATRSVAPDLEVHNEVDVFASDAAATEEVS